MSEATHIAENFVRINEAVCSACNRSGRSIGDVQIVAVSKKQSSEDMKELSRVLRSSGLKVIFGENYVQEFDARRNEISGVFDEVHFTGTLQSNKVERAVEIFDVIQTIHSEKITHAVAKACTKLAKRGRILLQVNISGDPGKSGFTPDELTEFLTHRAEVFESIDVEGLMTITAQYDDLALVREDYRSLRVLLETLLSNSQIGKLFKSRHLSMGMSGDFEVAIEEGATLVRIGTALFGERGGLMR